MKQLDVWESTMPINVGDLIACEHLYGMVLKKKTRAIVLVYWFNNAQTDGLYPQFEWCGTRALIKIQ